MTHLVSSPAAPRWRAAIGPAAPPCDVRSSLHVARRAQERMLVTLQEWLTTRGQVGEIAQLLRVHPQTVHYRVNKLQQLFGEHLTDPQCRFELTLATRVRLLGYATRPIRSPEFVVE